MQYVWVTPGESGLLLGLQARLVLMDERLDLRCVGEEAKPLFLIERDRETPQPVERYPKNVVVVATANKLARIAWAVLASGEDYRPGTLVTAA
jgi:hypothetical protein